MVFLRAKVIVIGDSCVGKSALCQVLSSDGGNYPKNYNSTIMTDLIIKQIALTDNSSDIVEMFILDNSGKALYFEHCKETWIYADMVCLVFDITNKESFGHLRFWYEKVKDFFDADKKPLGVVIGNKSDMEQRRIVSAASAKQFADSIHFRYFECSAKENNSIIEPFKHLASKYSNRYKEEVNKVRSIVE